MDDIVSRLEKIFAEIFWNDPGPASEKTRENTASWDSLAHLNLVLSIEQEFGIALADPEVVGMTTFPAALALVRAKVAGAVRGDA
jgi:acyl carrier protein